MSSHTLAHDLVLALHEPPRTTAGRRPVPRAERPPLAPPVAVPPSDPARTGAERDLASTLRSRRSTRLWAPEPVDAAELLDLLAAAAADEVRGRAPGAPALPPLEVTAVALRVDGLAPGIHDLDPTSRTATHLAPLPPSERLRELTLQAEFCDAAVILSLGADLSSAGPHAYREQMTRASVTAYGAWLAAVARGWVGSVFAGLLPAALRGPLGSDGVSRHQLFALALGLPAAYPAGPAGPAGAPDSPTPSGGRGPDPTHGRR